MADYPRAWLREDVFYNGMTNKPTDNILVETGSRSDLSERNLLANGERMGYTKPCNGLLADEFVVLLEYSVNKRSFGS
jgi:hypothetical protein